uniref:Uncharacterized protein n=1 Tax=Arundo donax TaxID=35708 RepID=A0A0A8YCR1_ARUDO
MICSSPTESVGSVDLKKDATF